LTLYVHCEYSNGMPSTTRSSRLAFRFSPLEEQLIRDAAESQQTSMTSFVADAVVAAAENVLADRSLFVLSSEGWAELVAILERPARSLPELTEFLKRTTFVGHEDPPL
jgi:uncharacterized protein (DUF1778 family)